MLGGKDYDESQFNRATQGLRQPGSSFKAFVYLTAMENGYTPDSIMDDAPVRIGDWSPHNYENRYEGPVTLRTAFAQSINTVAARVIRAVGVPKVIAVAHQLGITTPLRKDASLALGTSEVTPLDMTTAYAAFANGGYGVNAYGISEIDDTAGHVLYRRQGGGFGRVIPPGALAKMDDLMGAVIQEGTGRAARLDRPAAGKTGTTQDYRDAWFMGFTADYVTGVWMGNDDPRHTMRGVVGGSLPARLWKQVMLAAERGRPVRPLVVPNQNEGVANAIGSAASAAADAAGSAVHGIGDALDSLIHSLFGK
jgi:penicillin-binding protein 1A